MQNVARLISVANFSVNENPELLALDLSLLDTANQLVVHSNSQLQALDLSSLNSDSYYCSLTIGDSCVVTGNDFLSICAVNPEFRQCAECSYGPEPPCATGYSCIAFDRIANDENRNCTGTDAKCFCLSDPNLV